MFESKLVDDCGFGLLRGRYVEEPPRWQVSLQLLFLTSICSSVSTFTLSSEGKPESRKRGSTAVVTSNKMLSFKLKI